MSRTITLFFVVIFTNSLFAQISNIPSKQLLFNNYHVTFQLGYLQNQIQQKGIVTQGKFKTFANRGGFIGGTLVTNPYPNLGLEIGTTISLQTFGYQVELDAEDFGLAKDFYFKQSIPEVYLEVPLVIMPRMALNDENWLFARLGMITSWYAPLSVDFNLSSNPQKPTESEALGLVTMTFMGDNPYFSILSGIGFQHLTKTKNLIGLNLNATFGFSNILEGTFAIWDNEVPVGSGHFSSKGNYIGLNFTYTFTGVQRLEEKMKQNLKL